MQNSWALFFQFIRCKVHVYTNQFRMWVKATKWRPPRERIHWKFRGQQWSWAVQTHPSEGAAARFLSQPPRRRPRQKGFIKVNQQWCGLINCSHYASDTASVNAASPDWLSRRLSWQKLNSHPGKTKQAYAFQGLALFGTRKQIP